MDQPQQRVQIFRHADGVNNLGRNLPDQFRALALRHVFSGAVVADDFAARIAHRAHIHGHPDGAAVLTQHGTFKTFDSPFRFQAALQFLVRCQIGVKRSPEIGDFANHFRRRRIPGNACHRGIDGDQPAIGRRLEKSFNGALENAAIFFLGSLLRFFRHTALGDVLVDAERPGLFSIDDQRNAQYPHLDQRAILPPPFSHVAHDLAIHHPAHISAHFRLAVLGRQQRRKLFTHDVLKRVAEQPLERGIARPHAPIQIKGDDCQRIVFRQRVRKGRILSQLLLGRQPLADILGHHQHHILAVERDALARHVH